MEAGHARNYKTLHRAEDAVALCVEINDHTYLSGWFVYKTMMPIVDIDFSNLVVFPI